MRRRGDFDIAVRRGRRAGRRLLVGHLGRVGDQGVPLVGFVVSRAVGDAPTRNRVRRRLRHLAADRLAELPSDARLVIRAKPASATATFAELRAELDTVISRLLDTRQERAVSR